MPFEITYRTEDGETKVTVDPAAAPFSRDGEPGSLLDIALGNGVEIDDIKVWVPKF